MNPLRAALTILSVASAVCGYPSAADVMNAKAKTPLKTVSHVELARYMGDWRVIANVPYFAERGCVDSIEGYRLRPDGRIDNFFTYRKRSFDAPQKQIHALATVYNKETNAEWRIRFFGLITAKYFITDLGPHYQWTVVAHPSRKYGWIMSRQKTLPDSTYQGILARLESQGYQATQFQKVLQIPPGKIVKSD
jgi:apolipoprotein D and lipocalin family protein